MPDTQQDAAAGWYSAGTATLGDRLAGAREDLGMTTEELARRLGVKHRTLLNWEEDLSEPRANKLQMVSGVLNVSVMWLLNGEGDGLEAPEDHKSVTEAIKELLGDMRALKAEMNSSAAKLDRLEKRLRMIVKDKTE